jgi:hypothetical protein
VCSCLRLQIGIQNSWASLKFRCLIHNAHLGKILSFCQIFDSKNNTLKGSFWLIFSFNIYRWISGLTFKSKTIFYFKKLCVLQTRKF